MTVNGQNADYTEGLTVESLLAREGFLPERVVVERNREIVPRERYSSTELSDRDQIEILQFVGGG